MYKSSLICQLLLLILTSMEIMAQVNYDEAAVPAYTLPDPLKKTDGTVIKDTLTWLEQRRPEIMALFESEVYGKTPSKKLKGEYEILSLDFKALDGGAIRKEIRIKFQSKPAIPSLTLLIYLPVSKQPVPVFLGLNFYGNHTIMNDRGITVSKAAGAASRARGMDSLAWPVKKILAQGFGVATIFYEEIDPDSNNYENGIEPAFYARGQEKPRPGEWGSIGAWAWGLSRAMDYLQTDKMVDASKVAVIGHSRLGKTALWAGAQDKRFAMVISNNSGCGGAALSKRIYGETVATINKVFPYWFSENFRKYNNNEKALPVDQHELIALIAPRPVYVASAVDDQWADPKGEFLGLLHANPVYLLFGKEGLPVNEMPPVDEPVMGTLGYHIRTGGHAITYFDWDCYLAFAKRNLKI